MSKLWGLYVNEMYKLIKKPLVIILIVLIFTSGLLFPALIKFAISFDSEPYIEDKNTIETQLQYYKDEKTKLSSELLAAIDNQDDEYYIEDLKMQIDELETYIFQSELFLELQLFDEPEHVMHDSFIPRALSSLNSLNTDIINLNKVPEEERDDNWAAELDQAGKGYAQLYDSIKNKDFTTYNNYQIEAISAFKSILSSYDAEIHEFSLKLLPVIDPTGGLNGEIDFEAANLVADYASLLKYELDNNVNIKYDMIYGDQSIVLLSEEQRLEKQEEYDILMYKIENKQVATSLPKDSTLISSLSVEFSNFFLSILIFFAAGSIVANEMTTGSIKTLIIAPVRRWKIFTSKFLTLLTLFLVASLVLHVATSLGNNIFFDAKHTAYLFVSDGKVVSIPGIFFGYFYLLADHTLLFVLMLLAFMLSTVSRHSAVGIAIPFALMMVTSWASMMLSSLPIAKARWMDFLYFYNTDLADRLFPMHKFFDLVTYIRISQIIPQNNLPSLSFSVLFVLVLCVCLFYIAFDSFTRRDIK